MSETTTTTELAILPRATLPTILAADTSDILGTLAAELTDFEPDATTAKGRAEIGSKARKVGEAKMNLVRLANSLTEGWRQSTAAVVAERKIIEEKMDALREQVEAPRKEYEAREKRRVDTHESRIKTLEDAAALSEHATSWEIAKDIDTFTELYADEDFEEFSSKAHKARTNTLNAMRVAYQTAKTREDEAEAARIAAEEQAERQREAAVLAQIAREERIAAEAAEAARVAAEAEAERKRVEAEEIAQARLQAAEALRVHQAEEAARKEREAAEALAAAAERERVAEAARVARHRQGIEALCENPEWGPTESSADIRRRLTYLAAINVTQFEEFAEEAGFGIKVETDRAENFLRVALEREAAEEEARRVAQVERETRQRQEAEAEALRRQEAAVEAERQRVAREAAAAEAEADRRAADTKHRAAINRAALAGILTVLNAHWVDDDLNPEKMARHIVTALARGEVDYVKVQY